MDIDAAMEKAQSTLDAQSSTEAAPVVESTATAAPAEGESAVTPAPAEAAPEASDGRTRDGKGRFAPSQKTPGASAPSPATPATGVTAAAAGATTPPVPAAAPEPKWKPPQAWKPLAREKWGALPPEVQEEIARREGEVPRALQEAADARKFQAAVQETFRPYEMLARAAGQHPVAYAANLMQTAAALQTGAPRQRAAVVANIIKSYGVDVNDLAAELDGQPSPAGQQAPQVDPRAIIREELERYQAHARERSAATEVESFAAKHEFAADEDIRDLMASYITSRAHRGVEVSLEDAYARAVAAHPEYSKVMESRRASAAAVEQNASAQRALAAGVSIRSQPAAPMRARTTGIDGAMRAAADKLGM